MKTKSFKTSEVNQKWHLIDAENKTLEEIKKVYRVKRKEFHPDALISKGLPEELIEKAKEKFIEIQAAFEIIEKEKK